MTAYPDPFGELTAPREWNMHDTAYEHGRWFFELYWSESFQTVVELGSQDVNGSLRDQCPTEALYIGVDVMPAKGVDLVVGPGDALPVASESVDVVVTSSALEHDICFWDTFLELVRILRPGGLLYINAPSNGPFHRCSLDCWRFYPDAGVALARWATRHHMSIELAEIFRCTTEGSRLGRFHRGLLQDGGTCACTTWAHRGSRRGPQCI